MKNLTVGNEAYVLVIKEIQEMNQVARAKDIAERLNVTRAAVTNAFKSLAEKGMINYEPYSFVTLTEQGEKVATELENSRNVVKNFLMKTGVATETEAKETAEKIMGLVPEMVLAKMSKRNKPRKTKAKEETETELMKTGTDN